MHFFTDICMTYEFESILSQKDTSLHRQKVSKIIMPRNLSIARKCRFNRGRVPVEHEKHGDLPIFGM